jgi:hypothetical protein
MDLAKQNSTVAAIMAGESPSVQELASLAPLLKIAKSCIAEVEAHIKDRLTGGEEVDGCRMKKGAERRDILSATQAFKSIRSELGDSFDAAEWSKIVKISASDAQKFLVSCGAEKKTAKEDLARILGSNLKVSQNKPSLEVK